MGEQELIQLVSNFGGMGIAVLVIVRLDTRLKDLTDSINKWIMMQGGK